MPRKSKKQIEQEQLQEQRDNRIVWIVITIVNAALILFAITKMGRLGLTLSNILTYLFGSFYVIPLLTLFGYGVYSVFLKEKYNRSIKLVIGLIVANVMIIIFGSFFGNNVNTFGELGTFLVEKIKLLASEDAFELTGGLLGNLLYVTFVSLVNRTGTLIILLIMLVVSLILIIPAETYRNAYEDTKERLSEAKQERAKRKEEERIAYEQAEEERKLKLAEEMAAQQAYEDEKTYDEPEEVIEEEPIIEESVEEKPVDTYSTNSPFLINLTSSELGVSSKKSTSTSSVTKNDTTILGEEEKEENTVTKQRILKVKKTNGVYKLPKPLDQFLEANTASNSNINKTSAAVKGEKVIEILSNFGIESTLVNTYIGPSVTKFEIKPDASVKINKINNISDNIKMELAARDIRIEAPIPGRSAVGVEIPNVEPIPVKMIDLMKTIPADKKDTPLLFALGKDLMGKSVYCDISKMPHLLIAGATGSGKSVCINSIITTFLLRTNPDDVKLVLVDPKKVEFTPYKDIPHLLWPIIDDAQMASNMLKKVVVMMEDRYDAFASVGVRNIQAFNELVVENNANLKNGESPMNKMPYIVVIIDELADLMAIAGKDVELSIQRITQLARASGIHLIVATQRPSTDVITGLIKSNIPSRISFAVASSIDSRTILDATGAERLLGNGDMLYHPQGENAPMRLQGVFVTDREIQKITSFVKSQAKPEYEDSYFEFLTNMNGTTVMGAGSVNADSMDSLYDDVVEFVTVQQKASTSLLQRRFGIGYNRAARLIDTLEDRGIIGPANSSKPREVYRKPDDE